MTRINRPPGVARRRPCHPRRDEPSRLLLAPRIEDLVHPAHVQSTEEAAALALTRWLELWALWRGAEAPVRLRPAFRDREAYEAALIARHSDEAAQ